MAWNIKGVNSKEHELAHLRKNRYIVKIYFFYCKKNSKTKGQNVIKLSKDALISGMGLMNIPGK